MLGDKFLANASAGPLNVNLHTQGEYSVMSEDALWNAFADQQTLAWQRLRSAIAVLDKDGEQPG